MKKLTTSRYSIIISAWGTNDAQSDINIGGLVDIADLSVLLSNWT